jgi:hypothetical protein
MVSLRGGSYVEGCLPNDSCVIKVKETEVKERWELANNKDKAAKASVKQG